MKSHDRPDMPNHRNRITESLRQKRLADGTCMIMKVRKIFQGKEGKFFFETVVVGADDRCYNKFLNSYRWFPCGQWKFSDPPQLIPIVGRVAWCGCVK